MRSELVRFVLAGALVIPTDLGVYYGLIRVLPYSAAKGLSFVCGGTVAYLLNKYWIFKRRRQSSAEAVRFVVFSLLLLGLNVLTNHGMRLAWPGAVLWPLLTATALTGAVSYVGFKWWVFRDV